jgi:hypothetical protein
MPDTLGKNPRPDSLVRERRFRYGMTWFWRQQKLTRAPHRALRQAGFPVPWPHCAFASWQPPDLAPGTDHVIASVFTNDQPPPPPICSRSI